MLVIKKNIIDFKVMLFVSSMYSIKPNMFGIYEHDFILIAILGITQK